MIYAYDQALQLPTVDLYDTQMMTMAVNAAKDMYDRGQQQLKDFYKEYGDFMSPFAKDMERYGQMIGNVRNLINDAYARGIDLARSPEGRALIQRAVYSVNPAEYNRMRTNAKVGFEYLDAIEKAKAKNEFNQAFEDWTLSKDNGGPGSFNEFSSAGGAMWNRPAPYTYQDLNQFTGHIFDKMDDSFIETRDGFDYYGVTREERAKALTQHLSGLLSQPLGRFHYENSKAAYEAMLGRKLSDDEAMKYWQRDILDSTKEYEHRNRKANDFVLDDYRTNNDIRAHRANAAIDHYYKTLENGGGDGNGGDNEESGYSLLKDMYVTTLAGAAGIKYPPKDGFDVNELPQLLKKAEQNQKAAIQSGADVLASTGQFISMDKINGVVPSSGANGRGHFLSPEAILNLRTEDAVRTSFKGWVQKGNPNNSGAVKTYRNNESKKIANALAKLNGKNGFYVKVVPTTDKNGNNMYPMVGNDNRWHTYARMRVYLSDGKDTKPATLVEGKRNEGLVKMPKEGIELLLPIGLQSNESKASPDLSLSEREKVGIRPFSTVKKWIGLNGDADFPWGNNLIKEETSLQK